MPTNAPPAQSNRRSPGHCRRGIAAALAAGALAATALVGAGTAGASAPIEGIWSFNGGKVGIQGQPDGTFVGTVVAPTKFSQCLHPAGEQIWTGIAPQADGSYWGFHQWYFASEACVPNPERGLTAWRVLRTQNGSRFLRVCLSEPGSSSQPAIAPDGTSAHATFGCVDSGLIAPLPVVKPGQFGEYVALPGNRICFGRLRMRIRVKDPKNDPIKAVVVTVRSGKVVRKAKLRRRRHGITATVSLKGLPASSFTVVVKVTTVLGNHFAGRRTYRSCPKKLHPPRPHHLR
jgi:hypothetical protein